MTPNQAYRCVRSALVKGILIRPHHCERCGAADKPCSDGRSRIQAHHHDYNVPLDVEWICSKCHRAETPLPEKIGGKAIGEINGQSKLTAVDVLSARRLRSSGHTYQSIADRFGVDKKTAMRAVKGELWVHVAAAPEPSK